MFCQTHDQQFAPIDRTDDAVRWGDDGVWPLAVIRAAAGMLAKWSYLARIHNAELVFPRNSMRLADTRFLWSHICSSSMKLTPPGECIVFKTQERPAVCGTIFAGWYSLRPGRELEGWYSMTVAPYAEGHRFILAYGSLLTGQLAQRHLLSMRQQLAERFAIREPGTPQFWQTLTRELLATTEEICVSPTQWEAFGEEQQQAIMNWFRFTSEEDAFLPGGWEAAPLGREDLVDLFCTSG